jgi:HAE1 family hydrophobic/amphiphilic exporter-1
MMTSFAALASAIPIALGLGAGAESRRPLGLAVVGGLVVSQLLTLYITPSIYVYMEHFTVWLRQGRTGPTPVVADTGGIGAK